jgi:hypothetical protein
MSARGLDPEKIKQIEEMHRAGKTNQEIRIKLKLCENTVLKYVHAFDAGDDPIAQHDRRIQQQRAIEDRVKSIKEIHFRQFLEKCIAEQVQPLEIPKKPKERPSRRRSCRAHERYPLLTLTDWHYEETVNPEGVLELNQYSISIACKRIWRVVHSCLDWKRDMEASGRYVMPELVVALMGDMMTGTLHGLERHSGAQNIVRAALGCGDLISLVLADLAAAFPRIKVVGVVGNHGRLPDDKKVPTKDPTRSWDFLAYQVAKRRLTNVSTISWDLPNAYGRLFDVGTHPCYLAHGNFIQNNLGIVGYGVRRFSSALASNLNAAGKSLRYCFFGHWHQQSAAEFAGMSTFICPSLIGTQEYSFLSGGAVNRPAQQMYIMDRELGLVSQETFYGDGPETNPGSYQLEL